MEPVWPAPSRPRSGMAGLGLTLPTGDKPVRFPVAFRVGVTGTRSLDLAAEPVLRQATSAVLRTVAAHTRAVADEPWAKTVHLDRNGRTDLRLRLMSPLAEGADRLVAEEAGNARPAIDYELSVALPFVQEEYEKDFPNSVPKFRALLERAQARVLSLDGGRGLHTKWRSYEAVGRWVARNCDLLIAIWDDDREGGRGGTEDIVGFAVRIGLPVWWIQASGAKPGVLIEDLVQFRNRNKEGLAATSDDRLRRYIGTRLRVPKTSRRAYEGIHHRLVEVCRWSGRKLHLLRTGEDNPLHDFLAETLPRQRVAWRAHQIFMSALCLGLPRPRETQSWLEDAVLGAGPPLAGRFGFGLRRSLSINLHLCLRARRLGADSGCLVAGVRGLGHRRAHLVDSRRRVRLSDGDSGPRDVELCGTVARALDWISCSSRNSPASSRH